MECFKEMEETQLQHVLDELNSWWEHEDIPESMLLARVLLAFMAQRRLADGLEDRIQDAQYGFR
eukprot:4492557-Alexandrium_andersonii.AAC.1